MKRAAKIIVGLVSLVFVAALGYYLGLQHGLAQYGLVSSFYMQAIEQEHYQAFMNAQSKMGTNEAKAEAIKQYIAITERRQSNFSPIFTEKTYAVDLMLSYARLAALAENRGSAIEATHYLEQAESYCPKVSWEKCSAEVIKQFTQSVDALSKENEPK